jgi:hypothetical protein
VSNLTKQILYFALVIALALYGLSLSIPRLQASLLYLPVQNAFIGYWNRKPIGPEQLPELKTRTEAAIAHHDHPRFHDGLSLLHYIEAGDEQAPLFQRREAYEQAIAEAEASLRAAPVQPRLWLRKAHAENWLSFTRDRSVDAFKMSVLTSRVEPTLLMSRLLLGYYLVGDLDEEGRALLRDQTLLAWNLRQRDLLQAIRRDELSYPRIKGLLSESHPDVVAEMEAETSGRVR